MDAQINAVRVARRDQDADWIVMLSAEDYPLVPLSDFERYLSGSTYSAFLEDFRGRPQHASQLLRYARNGWSVPAPLAKLALKRNVRRAINGTRIFHVQDRSRRMKPLIEVIRRPPLRHCESLQTGSNWWVLAAPAADALLDRVDNDDRLVSHFRRTFIPSEGLVHTILMSNPGLEINPDFQLHHTKWSGWSPAYLTEDDLPSLLHPCAPFARKFEHGSPLMDVLDRHLGIA
jgi:hypothetical protein